MSIDSWFNAWLVYDKNSWKLLAGNGNVKVAFVIPQEDIEFWQVPLDEFGLADKRLYFGRGLDPLQCCRLRAQAPHFVARSGPEIRRQPFF